MNKISKINLFDKIDLYCYSNLNKFIRMKIRYSPSFNKLNRKFIFFRLTEPW